MIPGTTMLISAGASGDVLRIGMRSSTLRTAQGAEVIVPNSKLIEDKVTNWTLSDRRRRIELDVGVTGDTDPARIITLLADIARRHPRVSGAGGAAHTIRRGVRGLPAPSLDGRPGVDAPPERPRGRPAAGPSCGARRGLRSPGSEGDDLVIRVRGPWHASARGAMCARGRRASGPLRHQGNSARPRE